MSSCPSTFNFMHEILNRSKRQYKRHHQSGNKSHKLTYAIWPRHELLIIITFHVTGTYHLGMSNKLITNLFKHSIIPVPNPCNSSNNFLLLKLAEEANKQASKARERIQKKKKTKTLHTQKRIQGMPILQTNICGIKNGIACWQDL